MFSRLSSTKIVLLGTLVLLSLFAGIWLTADFSYQVGSQTVVTDFSRGQVFVENFVGDFQGYGREDFSDMSFRLFNLSSGGQLSKAQFEKHLELLALQGKSDDTGIMIHVKAAEALRRIAESEGSEVAYAIAQGTTNAKLRNPLEFPTLW